MEYVAAPEPVTIEGVATVTDGEKKRDGKGRFVKPENA